MKKNIKSFRPRLIFVTAIFIIGFLGLILRSGYLQIVKGEELRLGAMDQWTKGVILRSNRGNIFDRNGKKMAVSVASSTVYINPQLVNEPEEVAKALSQVLNIDEEDVLAKLNKNSKSEKIKQWVDKEELENLKGLNIPGIDIVDDYKRLYPFGEFASYILGFTNIDNDGQEGLEVIYNDELKGTQGRWIKTTDAASRQLPFDEERIFEASNGLSIVSTIDETIQHIAERVAIEGLTENKAKGVTIIVMDPNTGDILGLSNKPDYNPNSPRTNIDEEIQGLWNELPEEDLVDKWYEMWRNPAIADIYEPGSTYKLVTAAAALEENLVKLNTNFYCDGFVRDIPGEVLRCSSWYDPHKDQTLIEAMNNSCNVAFINLGRHVGSDLMVKYTKAFGFGEITGIDLNGEQSGIIFQNAKNVREIELATMSYGHGLTVTPIQLINSVSAMVNGGNLMKPRLVKAFSDDNNQIVEIFEPEVKRKVISESTSATMRFLLEEVVRDGSGNKASVPGYRIGGKTGTAQKLINGSYEAGKYISSFVGVGPMEDPQFVVLVIIDEPSGGQYYGSAIAAPLAGQVFKSIFKYLELRPSEEVDPEAPDQISIPDVKGLTISQAGKILVDSGFRYSIEYYELTEKSIVWDQYPEPGSLANKGSIIDLYFVEGEDQVEDIE